MRNKIITSLIILLAIHPPSLAQVKADDIIGVWLITGKQPAKIQVYKSAGKYYGKITWLKFPSENGKPKIDNNNPAKSKRNQPIIGLLILKGFEFDGDDEWGDGDIYDPESGTTYNCYLSLKDKNTLRVRGYVGISLFGRTELWKRTDQ
jgi:uncharacterized protein (DUF2147 family)